MAIVIPDLFGAFQKGREYAIDRNWKDLENYETIEKMRTANDMAQLALLQERYYTPLKMSMFADNADNSAMQNQIQFTAYPGALSRARQFTNQAVSDEGVQRATLSDTAQTQIGKTLSDNAMVRGQSEFNASQAKNTEWGKNGAIAAAMTNYKAGKALSNAEWEQVLFELQAEAQKGTLGQTIFMNGVNKKNRPLIEQLTTQVLNNDFASAQKTFEQIMKGEQGTGSSGQAIKFVNPVFKDRDDLDLANMAAEIDELERKYPNASEEAKVGWNDRRRAIREEQKARGIEFPSEQQVERGAISLITNASDYRLPMFRSAVPLATQQDANQVQDLAGGGQLPQTQATNLVGNDINAHLENVKNDSSISEPLRKAKLSAGTLERDSSLFNNWGGIFGETDQPATNILVNGVETPISNKTLEALNKISSKDKVLTPNQALVYKALLDNKRIQKTTENGIVVFIPQQLIPRSAAGVNPVSPNYGFNRQWYRW